MDILGELPIEVAEMILKFLNPDDLIICSGVSRRWRKLVNNERIWSRALPYAFCFSSASYETDCDSEDMEVNPIMGKYLEYKLAMKRLKEEKHVWGESKYGNNPYLLRPDCIWMPSLRSFEIGHEVKLSHPIEHSDYHRNIIASEDYLYLACSYFNIMYIYTRITSTSKLFHLLEIWAFKEYMECVIWREESNKESAEVFFNRHLQKDYEIRCEVFTGTGNERIICFKHKSYPDFEDKIRFVVWNVSSSRLVTHFKFNNARSVSVKAGWDGHGLCISFPDAIKCYDSEGRLTDTFDIPQGYHVMDMMLMRSFSIVFAAVCTNVDEGNKPNMMMLEFRRDESSVSVGFEIYECRFIHISLEGGPAYPVAYIYSYCEECSTHHVTSLYFGLLSTSGVSSWHSCNFCSFPIGRVPHCRYFFQFVDTSSYLLVHTQQKPAYLLYKVIMSDTEEGKEVKLELVPEAEALSDSSDEYHN